MKPDVTTRLRVVEINHASRESRILAVANDRNEPERLCDLLLGELTLARVLNG